MKYPSRYALAGSLAISIALTACSESVPPQALGTLERDRLTLVSTAAEFIVSQPVPEGSKVAAGTLVVQLDTTLQQSGIAALNALIEADEANLLKLQAGPREEEIAAARARTDTAQAILSESDLELTRVRDLVNRRLSAQADLDKAESLQQSNAARLRETRAQLQLLIAGTRDEDLAQARARLDNLHAQMDTAQRHLADLSLNAPRSAIVDSLPWETGERVNAGAIVAILLSDEAPYARIYLPEPWRQQIAVGSTLPVHVDGTPTVYTGTVRWIALEPGFTPYYALNSAERSRLVYLTEIQLPESARDLPAGLPVQVELPQ